MTKKELQNLLEEMSLEEKISQMSQVTGNLISGDSVITGPLAEIGLSREKLALSGSVLGIAGAKELKELQKEYMKNHPHHIPVLFMMDIINGYKTIYPIPLGMGATFDPDLAKRCCEMAAKEAAAAGLHVTFSPMCDLVRDARWGRVMESTGEDTYLNGLFAEAMVEGYQGEDLKEKGKIAACVKHFAGYGAPDAGRDYNTVELSDHTLREFYFPAYKKGIDAGAALVMSSFNTLEGIPVTGNQKVLQNILRDEMGFEGVVISDWAAIEELIYHGYAADRRDAAAKAMKAGVDIDMMTGIYAQELEGLVKDGVISEEQIDQAVMRILELKNKLGLFEHPYKEAEEEQEEALLLCKEHRDLAREAARKSFVLLKNEGVLPLHAQQKIAFIGPYTKRRNIMGSWSITGEEKDIKTFEEVLRSEYQKMQAEVCAGSPMLGSDMKLEGFTEAAEEAVAEEENKEQMLQEALAAAKEADLVVMMIGEDRLQSGEATSNATIQIPQVQLDLLEEVAKVNENLAVVLFCGRPLDIRAIQEKAKAIMAVWLPGTEGASAILEVLTGQHAPEGKLPMCFPYSVGQVPVHYNEYSTGRPYQHGKDKDRFRSKYLDIPNEPLYSFGYGLTYTTFALSDARFDRNQVTETEGVRAFATLTNTGVREGTETLLLYIRDKVASVVRPVKELKAFQKVTLQPQESKEISFVITEQDLRFLTAENRFESEEGEFDVWIGETFVGTIMR